MLEAVDLVDYAFRNGVDYPLIIITCAFLFFFGSLVASFSGLVAARIGDANEEQLLLKSISYPPSHCESCKEPIRKLALMPFFGWFISKGKCSCCSYKVPIKYPLIEGSVGLVSALIPLMMGEFGYYTLGALVILWVGVLISWIDWEHQVIPEELTWLLFFLGLLISPYEADLFSKVTGAALCCVAIWGSFTAVGLLKGLNTHSGGDVALATTAGAWLGMTGVPVFLLLTSLIYVAYSAPLRFKGIIWVPMGPALALGLFLSLFVHPLPLLLSSF